MIRLDTIKVNSSTIFPGSKRVQMSTLTEAAISATKRLRTVKNKLTGERATLETVTHVREWFWVN